MKTPLLLGALSILTLFVIPSCVDPNYYHSGTSYYGSASYTTMPYGYTTVHVSGSPYYYYGNSWYRRSSGRYIRTSRPHGYKGSLGRSSRYGHSGYRHGITRLPSGHRSVMVGGSRYYTHGNTWYRKSGSRYVTSPRPSGYSGRYLNSSRSSRSNYRPPSRSSNHSKYYRSRPSRSGSSNYRPTSSNRPRVDRPSNSNRGHSIRNGSGGRTSVTPRPSSRPSRPSANRPTHRPITTPSKKPHRQSKPSNAAWGKPWPNKR